MNLGDKIAVVATPIAQMVGADCIDPETNELRPESPCAERKRMLNEGRYADALFDVFRRKKKLIMRFTITIEVEADSVEDALEKKAQGKTLSVNPRPNPAAVQAGRGPGAMPFPMGKPQ